MRALLAFALGVAAVSAQVPATRHNESAPRPVRVDAIAVDAAGKTVENLKASDFELREDGTPQAIDEIRFVKVDRTADGAAPPIQSQSDERTEAASDNTRLVAIFLDEYQVTAGASTERARDVLTRFVDRDLGPRDLVTVMKPLDSLLTIRLTRDRDAIHEAIEAFDGRKGVYAPRGAFEQNYIASMAGSIEAVRAQVTLSALNALAIHLGSLSNARKTIVLVSEGLPRPARRRGFEWLPTLDSVVRAANRSNVSIYAVDPQEGASTGGAAADEDHQLQTLRSLASETDGEAIVGSPAVDSAMRRIADEASAYYLVTYHSEHGADGQFHEIQLRVKRPDIRVRARKGYWAPTPGELMRATMLAHAADPKLPVPLEPAPRISPLVRPWFGVARGPDGQMRVTFVWEPVERVPGDRTTKSPSRVVLTVLGADDTPLFTGPVLPAGPAGLAASIGVDAREESAARAVFDTPPGRLRLRMSIEDAAARAIDSDVRDIAIPDLKAPVALGTPEVLRARTARDVRALDADPDAVPVASREFSRTERLIVRFPAYAPDQQRPTITAKLSTRMGKVMRELPVDTLTVPDGQNQIDLPLAGLATGEYQIEITVASPAGQAKDRMNFRVTN